MSTELDADLAKAVRTTGYLRTGFYVVVLLIALGGQVSGAMEALDMDGYVALPAVGALELGGMVVLANSDVRRRLGEHATLSRLLSAGVALGAVAFNWLAHDNHLEGGFYAGMSLLGYLVYLMNSANKRRDRMRATGQMEATAPAYGLGQWVRHPGITRRARLLALESAERRLTDQSAATLGKLASLAAAREQVRTERREAGLAREVRKLIAAGAGKEMAGVAVDTYDMAAIARRLADRADYDGITRLLGDRLTADKLAGGAVSKPTHDDDFEALVDAVAPAHAERVAPAQLRPKRVVPAELDRVWAAFVSQHPDVYGSAQTTPAEPAQRTARESTREPRRARAVAAQSRPTTRRKKRLTVPLSPDERMAHAYAELTNSLRRAPSGTELAKAAQVSKATANRWKSNRESEAS